MTDDDHEPLTEAATLYRVTRKVRPLPGHPLFWKCQFGYLFVWLYEDSPEGAAFRAEKIIAALPYERVGEQSAVLLKSEVKTRSEGQSEEMRNHFELREQLARESGLALQLIICATGTDEAGFETVPLFESDG